MAGCQWQPGKGFGGGEPIGADVRGQGAGGRGGEGGLLYPLD